jgi:hypothetical protein
MASVCGKSAPRKDWNNDLLAICFLSLNSTNTYCNQRANRIAGSETHEKPNDNGQNSPNLGFSRFNLPDP